MFIAVLNVNSRQHISNYLFCGPLPGITNAIHKGCGCYADHCCGSKTKLYIGVQGMQRTTYIDQHLYVVRLSK